MQTVDLLGTFGSQADLDSFAKAFFEAIGIFEYEERESSNYIDEHYFIGSDGALSVQICIYDVEGYEDMPYWVTIDADMAKLEDLVDLVDQIVRKKAMPMGFRFARMINIGRIEGENRIDY